MIQANELRIGNWVLDSDRDNPYFHQVVRIETKEYTEWDSGNEFNIVCLLEGTKDSYFEIIPSPIPLTEEWLVRFGFRKTFDSPFEYFEWTDHNLQLSEKFDCYLGKFTQPIKYVHQLQNLYFALTGEELKLTENDTH